MPVPASCQRLSGPRSGEGLEVLWAGSDRAPFHPSEDGEREAPWGHGPFGD